jgi:uncharacterized glyoxalase superfamily protein PhnB
MQRGTKAGDTVVQTMRDQFYDSFGHVWHLATHKEDLSGRAKISVLTPAP